ncbi:hypothetical protein [Vibrio sp. Vb0301]|uniref:hypothetical protein n=1 Tax=Vibrio sp. Vb0301 TaxID=3074622 RepID=UPI00296567A8|nr:hypothetical protein [Vibrio sp. Vb0301]MDW2011714.1 hypothetical protein [Vibrio sp. Vb0301]
MDLSNKAFINKKLLSKQSINSDEIASILKEAKFNFPELRDSKIGSKLETIELELFNKVLFNIMLKFGFRVPESHKDNTSSIYIRR